MIVTKSISLGRVLRWSGHHIVWLLALMGGVALMYYYKVIAFEIPWLPVSVIGTAVAFYVGFKNSQAYDRLWEARKIWGGIVNDSRSWGMMVDGFVTDQFTHRKEGDVQLQAIKKRLIYRHIAWLYAHRSQLLQASPWEHINQGGKIARLASYYQQQFGIGTVDEKVSRTANPDLFLSETEAEQMHNHANMATQLINTQSRDLRELHKLGVIDDFRHMEMARMLSNFYTLQGKNERIKKYPLPRQYANMSRYFVGIFIMMLPFSMMPELMKIGNLGLWLAVPISALIGWVYVMMEVVGDYSENPFQGMANDIPMLSLCRTIEIDLREMLGETELPSPISSNNGVLM